MYLQLSFNISGGGVEQESMKREQHVMELRDFLGNAPVYLQHSNRGETG